VALRDASERRLVQYIIALDFFFYSKAYSSVSPFLVFRIISTRVRMHLPNDENGAEWPIIQRSLEIDFDIMGEKTAIFRA